MIDEHSITEVTADGGIAIGSACVPSVSGVSTWCARSCVDAPASRKTERPAVGPERPFQLAPRVERTLPNGLRVIVTRQTAVPKVSVTLTMLSGYSSDPPDLTGLATMTGDLIQEGTKTRTSREIRREVFGMGGSLSAAASQDFTSVSARGLSEFAPRLIDLVADVAMNPTLSRGRGRDPEAAAPAGASRSRRRRRSSWRTASSGARCSASIRTRAPAKPRRRSTAIDRAKVVAFHRDHYRPNNAFLLVVGAVEPDRVFAAAEKAFGGWARGDVPQPTYAGAAAARPDATCISCSGRTASSRRSRSATSPSSAAIRAGSR